MCGILGEIRGVPGAGSPPFESCLDLLEHRGPDGRGCWRGEGPGTVSVALGHRRLSILDLSDASAQPMASADGRWMVVFNGEIYNFRELRTALESEGIGIRSSGDSEVLVEAWARWGPDALPRLDGMFAFAAWDRRTGELHAVRDRFGEKPFHWTMDERSERFRFASEIKALLPFPGVDGSIADDALFRYLAHGEQAGLEETGWRGVRRLPAGHRMVLRPTGDGRWRTETSRWWDLDPSRASAPGFDEAAAGFARLFEESVRLRLRADVPVGTSLSGGLDSSAVVCQVHRLGAAAGQKTFTARMDDPALDEGRYVRIVLEATGVRGLETWPSAEILAERFERLCRHLEEPFPSTSMFAQHLVMDLAREHGVTVLLDGQGADEMLAGYAPYFHLHYKDLLARGRYGAFLRGMRAYGRRHGRRLPLPARAVMGRAFPGLRRIWRRAAGKSGVAGSTVAAEAAEWWDAGWLARCAGTAAPPSTEALEPSLNARLRHDLTRGPLQELLRYGDRNSMAHGRELRQPFLDHRIVEHVAALPEEYKIRDGESKALLRRGFRGLVPAAILERQDKLGYQAPLRAWFDGSLREWVRERLASAVEESGGRLAAGAVARFDGSRGRLSDASSRSLMSVLTWAEGRRTLRELARAAGTP